MAALLTNVRNTMIAGFVLALVILIAVGGFSIFSMLGGGLFWSYLFRWLHVVFGVLWIGLLYYFNLVQMPMMPKIPDDQKPAITKFIAVEALWYFRWAAMATIVTGVIMAWLNGYLLDAITIGATQSFARSITLIGIGMWLGAIMWFNVWFVIWPNQQRALNIDNKYPDLTKDQRAAAGRTAMLFSRTNFLLSIPMLLCMVSYSHFPG